MGIGLATYGIAHVALSHSPASHVQLVLRWAIYVVLNSIGWLTPKPGHRLVILGDTFGMAPDWVAVMVGFLGREVTFVPAILCAFLIYHLCASRQYADGHTRCGQCWSILHGLTEPRCTKCGASL